ncbi:MAG: aminopeptidase [candidate division KSB1 bacterium]|nr:aminopeptidase [candidate division KSB1 bacterium]
MGTQLERAIRIAVHTCLGVQSGEEVVVVADEPMLELGRLFFAACVRARAAVALATLPPLHSLRPFVPASVAHMMQAANALVLVTSVSLSHTEARRAACRGGARAISLPGVTENTLRRAVDVDYKFISDRSRKLADIFTIGSRVHLTTPAGTDLHLSIRGMKGYADTGLVHEPGAFSNLPAGEAAVCPAAAGTHGRAVIETGMGIVPRSGERIILEIEEGRVVRVRGEAAAKRLRQLLSRSGPSARIVAELGVGTNPKARVVGLTLEDEKAMGTAHIALGNNLSFGGTNEAPVHIDGIMLKPTLVIDGKTILEQGEIVV